MRNKRHIKLLSIIALSLINSVFSYLNACTNILVSKGATVDGSTMITYAADAHFLYGELYFQEAREYSDTAMKQVYEWDTGKHLGKIKEAKKTYSVVGNMNEHQLVIAETTYGGRPELVDTTGIVDYGTLIYTTLQRAKSAREAIKTMDALVKEYGYCSSGESFSIADPNEVWIMELIGKGTKMVKTGKGRNKQHVNAHKGAVWVAMKLPDGAICAHANQARITTFPLDDTDNCLYADDVITFAREKGWFDGKDEEFSFSDTYAPLDFGGARFCEARVYTVFNKTKSGMEKYLEYAMGEDLKNRMPLFVFPDKKLSVKDVMELMRDYYQGTPMDMTNDIGAGPYGSIVRWRPLTWKVDSVEYFNERAISTQQTGFSFISQSRGWLPDPIGGILWFGVDDTYSTVYSPMYCGITKVPESFAVGNGDIITFSETSAFWTFNQVSNFAYTRYNMMIPEIRKKQTELENHYIAKTPVNDSIALELYEKDKKLALEFLTKYSVETGNYTVKEWKQLYYYLFTKYLDGNMKYKVEGQKFPKVEHPGYSKEWYKEIIEKTGEKFIYHGESH